MKIVSEKKRMGGTENTESSAESVFSPFAFCSKTEKNTELKDIWRVFMMREIFPKLTAFEINFTNLRVERE